MRRPVNKHGLHTFYRLRRPVKCDISIGVCLNILGRTATRKIINATQCKRGETMVCTNVASECLNKAPTTNNSSTGKLTRGS